MKSPAYYQEVYNKIDAAKDATKCILLPQHLSRACEYFQQAKDLTRNLKEKKEKENPTYLKFNKEYIKVVKSLDAVQEKILHAAGYFLDINVWVAEDQSKEIYKKVKKQLGKKIKPAELLKALDEALHTSKEINEAYKTVEMRLKFVGEIKQILEEYNITHPELPNYVSEKTDELVKLRESLEQLKLKHRGVVE